MTGARPAVSATGTGAPAVSDRNPPTAGADGPVLPNGLLDLLALDQVVPALTTTASSRPTSSNTSRTIVPAWPKSSSSRPSVYAARIISPSIPQPSAACTVSSPEQHLVRAESDADTIAPGSNAASSIWAKKFAGFLSRIS
jgi:hypothetical protein